MVTTREIIRILMDFDELWGKKKISLQKSFELRNEEWYTHKEIQKVLKKLWSHNATFEGIKCKTCLPLDYVEQVFEEELFSESKKDSVIGLEKKK